MKTSLLFVLAFLGCSKPDPVFKTLLKDGRTPNVISVIPTNSRCADSLNWQSALTEYRLFLRISEDALQLPESDFTKNVTDGRERLRQIHDSLYRVVASQPAPLPGFSLIRYTVNREPDTLTAVLDPSFRVVWPR